MTANVEGVENPQLAELREVGQSIWFDDCSREVLRTGKLEELVAQGVTGLTSNPTIFKKAIADSNDYDTDIAALAAKGNSDDQICEILMGEDVAAAADLLREVYDRSNGRDGYASIEVSPLLANDEKSTVEAAKRIFSDLNRPNVMIKIPATPAGIAAIPEVLGSGINVNVTLIFSCEVYEQVIDAYLAGLEICAERGGDLSRVSSVASFFVSRVDAIAEKKLAELVSSGSITDEDQQKLIGKIGIANSRLAYALFDQKFKQERFTKLAEKGALVQRPLWASTGTKN